ncbi:restriction endonuclease subunit S [Clostridium haemolyticum]|uniref:Type I restriction modification DNA specificity domain-containing protein n=1 Tax=Clostridium haemolyticum NCTC 9693 TaxID=1443114 RepID=A0ABR4TFH1_CLOHA|nr:restriction endonuclease subunit S [Clostridium haemolyticum]KEI16719.1 hypothetical protein Z960_08540 [Clostridium haemolyticum NCTC 9693]KGN04514.1 hypothetical protein Z961_02510 [Clostridium haemolyticum NCTC 8350]
MSFKEWMEVELGEVILFNPRENLKKGSIAKKIGMDKLEPFSRKIQGFEETEFKSGTKFRNGDTLLARITPCLENGKTAQVRILDKNEVGFGSTEFIVLREKENKTVNDFIYYLSISKEFRNIAIKSMTGTSGRQRAQKDVLEKTVIRLPLIEEQKAIANILSTLDEKIETNNQINKKLEEMAQTIFKHWFVDFEFPNEEGKPYKSSGGEMVESEMGMIPKGWEVGSLCDLVKEIVTGKTPSTKKEENYGTIYPFITIPDMHGNIFVIKTERYLSETGNKSQIKKLIPKNSIMVSCIATVGLVSINLSSAHTNQQINSIVLKKDEDLYYFYEYLKLMNEKLRAIGSTGSTTLNVNKREFEKIKYIYPTTKVMKKFYGVIKSNFEMVKQRQLENDVLINTRDTLLPKLMSGEIRVPLE